jgi:hypothetical protein
MKDKDETNTKAESNKAKKGLHSFVDIVLFCGHSGSTLSEFL